MTTASPLPPYSSRSGRQKANAGSSPGAKTDTARPAAPEADPQAHDQSMSPAATMLSTAAAVAAAPVAVTRQVLAAKGGLPLYAGLGGLALVGIIDWPVAAAAGAGYGLAMESSGRVIAE
jgi:hypothetical protein